MTPEILKAIIDQVFAYIEQKEAGHPLVVSILQGLNTLVDDTAIPIILGQLQARGVIK